MKTSRKKIPGIPQLTQFASTKATLTHAGWSVNLILLLRHYSRIFKTNLIKFRRREHKINCYPFSLIQFETFFQKFQTNFVGIGAFVQPSDRGGRLWKEVAGFANQHVYESPGSCLEWHRFLKILLYKATKFEFLGLLGWKFVRNVVSLASL